MTENKLATLIASIEGKKSQARIGDIREIIKVIQMLLLDETKEFLKNKTDLEITKLLFKKASKYSESVGQKTLVKSK